MDGYDEVRIQVDRRGQALGVTVIHDVGTSHERVRPIGVGPFDTIEDALTLARPYLTVQLGLW